MKTKKVSNLELAYGNFKMFLWKLIKEILKFIWDCIKILLTPIWEFLKKKRYIGKYPRIKKYLLISLFSVIYCYIIVATYFLINIKEVYIVERVDTLVKAEVYDSQGGIGEESSSPAPKELTLDEKICKVFPEDCETMIAISKAENAKRDPFAVGYNKDGSIDVGIFQINSVHGYDKEWLFDVDNNIAAAREVYDKQGKEAWVTYNTNKHLSHL